MLCIRFFLFLFFVNTISYSDIMSNSFSMNSTNKSEIENQNAGVSRKDFDLLSKKNIGDLSAIEAYLMGLWYYGGSQDLKIEINKGR